MALVPDARRCDRCNKYDATPLEIGHIGARDGERMVIVEKKDLCDKCTELLESAIKRAVRAK